jgi:hypothetical protein
MADLTNARFETLNAREAALSAGLCADCKIRPRSTNKDGKLGKRCEVCKVKTAPRPNQSAKRPVVDTDGAPETERRYYAVLLSIQKRIEPLLKKADERPSHKGLTQREIATKLNEDTVLVGLALAAMNIWRKGSVPEKYRYDPPPVRVLKPDEYPKNWQPPIARRPWDQREQIFKWK